MTREPRKAVIKKRKSGAGDLQGEGKKGGFHPRDFVEKFVISVIGLLRLGYSEISQERHFRNSFQMPFGKLGLPGPGVVENHGIA